MDDGALQQLKNLDWKVFDEFTLLGDLEQFKGLVSSDVEKRTAYSQLCSVLTYGSTHLHSLSVYAGLRLPQSSSGGEHVSRIQVADFYLSFFKEGSVSKKRLINFLAQHVTLVVARAIHHRRETFHIEIVAAITFSRPKEDVPTYLAYLAVADGSPGMPSLQDNKRVTIPSGNHVIANVDGYQGLGLGTMLIGLMGQVVTSAIECTPSALSCFLHYNLNNEVSADGWLKHGFILVPSSNDDASRDDESSDGIRERYDELVVAMSGERIFTDSDDDSCNIAAMFTKFITSDVDADDWYKAYKPDLDEKFIARLHPSVSAYALSNVEISAKYRRQTDTPPPNDLKEILVSALARKDFRIKHDDAVVAATRALWRLKSKRARKSELIPQVNDAKWTDQEYVDFACIQDENRTINADTGSIRYVGREKLVEVSVSSFVLPPDMSIEDVIAAKTRNLPRFHAVVECNWGWLRHQSVHDVSTVMEDALFGTPLVEGLGLDDTNWCTARKDVDLIASFSAKKRRDPGFLAPPVGHRIIKLPTNAFAKVGVTDVNPMRLIKHAQKTKDFRKHVKTTLKISKVPPPLPRSNHQLSRLKWVPTGKVGATPASLYDVGYYEGAYRVDGTSHYTSVSLNEDWVIHQFDSAFIRDVKVQGVTGQPGEKRRLICIPPGASRSSEDRPSSELTIFTKTCRYQQGDNTTCLFDSFCSAMYEFGCLKQVETLRNTPSFNALNQSNMFAWTDFNDTVNRHFKASGLQVFKQNIGTSVSSLLDRDDSFVLIASLKSNDGMEGQHAIAVYAGCIYDSNSHYVLTKTQESLDWCCGGKAVVCTGIHRSYQLLPTNYRTLDPLMRLTVRMRDTEGADVRGWIAGVKGKRFRIQLVNGSSHYVTGDELKMITRWLDGVHVV